MNAQIRTRPLVLAFWAGLALAAEMLVWGGFALNLIPLVAALAIHFAVALALYAVARTARDSRAGLSLLALATPVAGPFGAAGGVVMALAAAFRGRGDYARFRHALMEDAGTDGSDSVSSRRHAASASPVPFYDIIRWGSRREKQDALRRMAEGYVPVFAPALRAALADPAVEIRSEAAAASATILKLYERRVEAAMRAAADNDAAALAALGDAWLALAECGLAKPEAVHAARKNALAAYDRVLDGAPHRAAIRRRAARVLAAQNDYRGAARQAALCLAQNPADREARILYLEALFALGRFPELRAAMRAQTAPAPRRVQIAGRPASGQDHARRS